MIIERDILSFEEWDTDHCEVRRDYADRVVTQTDLAEATVSLLTSSVCPYCATHLTEISIKEPGVREFGHRHIVTAVRLCPLCGFWWDHKLESLVWGGKETVWIARLRRFPVEDVQAPLAAVYQHLLRKPDDLYNIHPRKLEELVGKMVEETMDCEVQVTCFSKDGGYDILCFDSAQGKFLVEVKRYASERKVGVGIVRHLAGVLVRENESRGIVVTTSHFTKGAVQEVAAFRASNQAYPIDIDLYSIKELLSYLDLRRDRAEFNVLDHSHIGDTLKYMRACEAMRIGEAIGDHQSRIMAFIKTGQRDWCNQSGDLGPFSPR